VSHMVNGFDPSRLTELPGSDRVLVQRRSSAMGAAYRLFYDRPVHVVRASGVHLYDSEGNEYLDAYNNVPVVGHSNERVREAVHAQLGLVNTHTRYLTDPVIEYAERLTALFPDPLTQAIFVCTGSEAVDLALRIARSVTGRSGVIVTRHAYHGTTSAAASISPSLGPNNPIPPNVALVDAPDAVRDAFGSAAMAFGERIDRSIAELKERGFEPAALVLDSVMSSDGLQVGDPALVQVAADRARACGALYVADEVQGGFGRTGRWWAFGQSVTPDLVVLGKPMGNGLPIAAVVGRPDSFDAFGRSVRYFNTFGGNPVCVAAASAVLDEIQERSLVRHAQDAGSELRSSLSSAIGGDPAVAQVRQAGLFLAVELIGPGGAPDSDRALRVVNAMRRRRILISASGTYDNVLKVRPPLVFPRDAMPQLIEGLVESFDETQ
jgi:4-aminobutyrate aminotransferase-like enzyme